MNPTTEPSQLLHPPLPPPLPPPPPQPNRLSTSCDRHPEEHFTGFCPSCLCERLAVLDHSAASSSTSSRKPPIPTTSTATAALKAIFKPSSSSSNGSFFAELRRTKSFSASKNEGFSGVFEPQRKSCDVKVRSTLWSLFYQDDERKPAEIEVEPRISSASVRGTVLETKEEDEIETESESENGSEIGDESGDIVRDFDESILTARNSNANPIEEIVEEEEEEEEEGEAEEGIVIEPELIREEELKPMKDHIDLDSQTKKPSGRDFKEIAGSFWSAASVFSKKLQKWRQKQKLKKRRNGGPGSATLPVEKPIGRQFRETQSEIADYGFGRRSCDTDPRFSLDAGRISFDDPRYSFDEPRASWDGYLIGRTFPRMPTMLSVVEDAPINVIPRSDAQIPVEEPPPPPPPPMNSIIEDATTPGGSVQTRDYYSDSSSRRRRSLDRSNSIRKTAAAVVAEIDEMKSNAAAAAAAVSNAKVSPASTLDYINGPKLVAPDRELRDSNSNSLRDDCSETFEMGFRDNASMVGNGERKGGNNNGKKSRRWSKAWNIWGFIHRRSVNKDDEEDRYSSSRANGVERSYSESWQDGRGGGGGVGGGFNHPKLMRSNSSVSWRNSSTNNGSIGGGRRSNVELSSKKRDEFVIERNRSARFSPNHIDNGLLRFYLTPMRSSSSRRVGWGKSKSSHAQSIARSVLRLY